MALNITCPSCKTNLRVRDEYAGRDMRCPRCGGTVSVAEEEPLNVEPIETSVTAAPPPKTEGGATKPCPSCGKQIALNARKCRFCRNWVEEEDEDQPRSEYKPCPRCGTTGATRVIFTFWGSFYGPALLTHVRCPECGYAYNGKTGRSNRIWAIIFVAVPLLGIITIIGGLIALLTFTMSNP